MRRVGNKQKKEISLLILALSVFGICTYFVSTGRFSAFEYEAFDLVYKPTGSLALGMYLITQTASVAGFLAIVTCLLVAKKIKLSLKLLTCGLVTYSVIYVAKLLIARPRPHLILPDVTAYYDAVSDFGFPSGHAAIAVTVAMVLAPSTPKRYRWLIWLWVLLVGISRISLGVHAPLDIVGGICVGVVSVCALRLVSFGTKKH